MWERTKLFYDVRDGAKGRERVGGGLEEEQAWENGNKEDKRRQSHFNLLVAMYVCLSSVPDHCSS